MTSDYFMREVERLTYAVSVLLFGRAESIFDIYEDNTIAEGPLLERLLHTLVADGEIREAERMVYEKLEQDPGRSLPLVLEFYALVAQAPPETLEEQGYTREKLLAGLRALEADWLPRVEKNTPAETGE